MTVLSLVFGLSLVNDGSWKGFDYLIKVRIDHIDWYEVRVASIHIFVGLKLLLVDLQHVVLHLQVGNTCSNWIHDLLGLRNFW